MKVVLRLKEASEPMFFDVKNAYIKGSMYCMRLDDGTLKFPLCSVFSVLESGGYSSQKAEK